MTTGVRLFVRSLPVDLDESNLRKQFSSYGNVNNIEIKAKKGLEDGSNKFAFVTLDADNYSVNKCIQDFSENSFQGMYLDVSIAKESFMDRLKRERSEALNKQAEKNKSFSSQENGTEDHSLVAKYKPDSVKINNFDIKLKPAAEKIIPLKNKHEEEVTQFQYKWNDNEKSTPFKKYEEEVTPFKNKWDINERATPFKKYEEEVTPFKNKWNNYEKATPFKNYEEKKVVQLKRKWDGDEEVFVPFEKTPKTVNADVTITPVNNKVEKVLTQSDIKRIESIQHMRTAYNEKKSLIKSALSNVDKKANNKIIFDDDYETSIQKQNKNLTNKNDYKKTLSKNKEKLFDDESEDDNEYNFEVKEKYHGESGRKLMELQSRFKSDKRFVLDERFLENGENGRNDGEDPVDAIESIEDNERLRQMQILQSVLGTPDVPNSTNTVKKGQIKTMLRYDPTRVDHVKYINTPAEKPKAKKEKKKKADIEKIEVIPAAEVSKERYYKVDDSLKKSMEEKQPFSLLSLFGKKDEEIADAEEYASTAIEKTEKKIKNPLKSKDTPFFYDSSDSEDDTKVKSDKLENDLDSKIDSGPLMIMENLFFSNDDVRLKEGLEFFMNKSLACNQSREKLKFIVKKRIQNNIRNDKFQAKKSLHKNVNAKPFKKR